MAAIRLLFLLHLLEPNPECHTHIYTHFIQSAITLKIYIATDGWNIEKTYGVSFIQHNIDINFSYIIPILFSLTNFFSLHLSLQAKTLRYPHAAHLFSWIHYHLYLERHTLCPSVSYVEHIHAGTASRRQTERQSQQTSQTNIKYIEKKKRSRGTASCSQHFSINNMQHWLYRLQNENEFVTVDVASCELQIEMEPREM